MIINSKIYNIPSAPSKLKIDPSVRLVAISNKLTETEDELLQKMFSATGLADTEYIHITPENDQISLKYFDKGPDTLKIISFAVTPEQLGLQVSIEKYRPFKLHLMEIVIVDDLNVIASEVNLKKFIWNTFKSWFIS